MDIQARGYALLRWIEESLDRGLVVPDRVDGTITEQEAAQRWIRRHAPQFPPAARPPEGEIEAFARFFSTYLASTFDFAVDPESVVTGDHCYCPICSFLVRRPHLTPKKVDARAKRSARHLMIRFAQDLAAHHGIAASESEIEALVADRQVRTELALCAYGADLLQRMDGVAVGAGTLVLWRGFAWNAQGSPIKGFRLTAARILEAQEQVLACLG